MGGFLSISDYTYFSTLADNFRAPGAKTYIPHLKVVMCGIHAFGAQLCDYIFILCYTHLKLFFLLHKLLSTCNVSFGQHCSRRVMYFCDSGDKS